MPDMGSFLAALIPFEGRAAAISVFHLASAAAVTVHALMNKRDAPAAIGWIGMAWLAPILGPLLYLGFGINRVKRRARRMMGTDRKSDIVQTVGTTSDDPVERLKIAVGNITSQSLESGRVAAILNSGDEAYPQMLAAIDGAKSSIELSTYIFRDDDLGRRFIDALAGAHGKGLKIRVLIDGFGGGFLRSSAYHELRRRGVPAARFLHSLLPWEMPVLNLRLHKKVLIIDGEIAFIGGLNIGAENLIEQNPAAPVRDTHFRVEGSVVGQIRQDFDEDWSFAAGRSRAVANPFLAEPPDGRRRRAGDRRGAGSTGRSVGSRPFIGDQSGPKLDPDRDALFPARRTNSDRPASCGAARRGRSPGAAGKKQSPDRGLGGPRSRQAVAADGMPAVAQPRSVRPYKAADDRWQMEPYRQRELGYEKPAPQFRTDGGTL